MRGRRRQDAPARPVLDGQRLPPWRAGHCIHAAVQGAGAAPLRQGPASPSPRVTPLPPLLQDESMLRAHDRLGFTPLDYLRDGQIGEWAGFIDAHKELFWSPRNAPGRSPEAWCELLWPVLGSEARVASALAGEPPHSAQITLPGKGGRGGGIGAPSFAVGAASGGAVPRGMAALPAPPCEGSASDAKSHVEGARSMKHHDPGVARRGGASVLPVDAGVAAVAGGGGTRRPGWGTLCFSGPT